MTGPPRDWDKELAEIDKIMARQGPAPGKPAPSGGGSAPALPAPRESGARAPAPRAGGRAALGQWVRVLAGVAVAAALVQWPYQHTCGMGLYAYVAAAAGVALVGTWGAVTSWNRRMGLAHLISLLVTVWGVGLVGKAWLDRTEYARHPATWSCP